MRVIDNLKEAIKNGDSKKVLEECDKTEQFIYELIAQATILILIFVGLAIFCAIVK